MLITARVHQRRLDDDTGGRLIEVVILKTPTSAATPDSASARNRLEWANFAATREP